MLIHDLTVLIGLKAPAGLSENPGAPIVSDGLHGAKLQSNEQKQRLQKH